MSFWTELNKPFFALAPMEDVTDTVFREIVLSVSNPNILRVLFTEFMSTDGFLNEKGRFNVAERLKVSGSEMKALKQNGNKLVVQIWGNNPQHFFETARQLSDLHLFDGIDINMGCPVKKVVKKNTCSALIRNPELAADIIQATKDGGALPVSVKTRIGFNTVATEQWGSFLLNQNLAAITFHGRTQKMKSQGQADWNEIKKVVDLRNRLNKNTVIIGNGDVMSYSDGFNKYKNFGVDGVMVGRGVFSNPLMFNTEPSSGKDAIVRLKLMLKHIELFKKVWGANKSELGLRRFFKVYIQGFPGASVLRKDVMLATNLNATKQMVENCLIKLETA